MKLTQEEKGRRGGVDEMNSLRTFSQKNTL